MIYILQNINLWIFCCGCYYNKRHLAHSGAAAEEKDDKMGLQLHL